MNAETIKEFLVALGFKVDDAGLKRFNVSIANATKLAAGLGTVAVAAATAVTAAVVKVSNQYESLYYTSQRMRASAENVKAYSYAFTQVGGSADQAKQAVMSVANYMKLNPAGESWIAGLGVSTRDANGKLRDTVEITRDLGKLFSKMEYWQANVFASELGIDTATLEVMMRDSDKFFNGYIENLRKFGVDVEKAAEASKNFMNELKKLWAAADIVFGAALLSIQTMATSPYWKQWGREIDIFRGRLDEVGSAFADLWDQIGPGEGVMKRVFGDMIQAEFERSATHLDRIASGIRMVTALLRQDWARAWQEARNAVTGTSPPAATTSTPATATGRATASAARIGAGAASLGQQAMDYFQSRGWTRAQAAGIVANLSAESAFNHKAVGDGGKAYGVAQWHPDRQAAFKKRFGKDIQQSSFAEQLAFVHHELTDGAEKAAGALLRKQFAAGPSASIVSQYYERPKDQFGEAAKRAAMAQNWFDRPLGASAGGSNVVMNQTTNINVNGAGDPSSVGRAVVGEQGRVNANALRHLKATVR